MTTRFRNGDVTVTLDDGLDKFVRGMLSAAETETVRVLETGIEEVRKEASGQWYGPNGVDRETGKSGDIQRITTFDNTKGEVRVSLGSTDDRKAGKTSKPVVAFVHRPRGDSLKHKLVDRKTWYATPETLRGPILLGDEVYRPVAVRGERARVDEARLQYYILEHNPKSSDGKYLLAEFVRKPVTAKVKVLAPEIAKSIVARASRG